MTKETYTLLSDAARHTCWDSPNWNGLLAPEGECSGCDEAVLHACPYCGYGEAFTTHNDIAHAENGDLFIGFDFSNLSAEWFDSPHI